MKMKTLIAAFLAATVAMAPVAAFANHGVDHGLPQLEDRVEVLEEFVEGGGGGIPGPAGADGIDGIDGIDGTNGTNGTDGVDGGVDNTAALLAEQQARITADEEEELDRMAADAQEMSDRIADIQEARDAREAAAVALAEGQAVQDEAIGTNTTNISNFNNTRNLRDDSQDARINDNSNRITDNSNRIDGMEGDINTLRKGIAGVAAAAAIHYDTDYVGVQVGAGVGYYDGREAIAVGVGGALSDRWFVNGNLFTSDGYDSTGASAGVTYRF